MSTDIERPQTTATGPADLIAMHIPNTLRTSDGSPESLKRILRYDDLDFSVFSTQEEDALMLLVGQVTAGSNPDGYYAVSYILHYACNAREQDIAIDTIMDNVSKYVDFCMTEGIRLGARSGV